MEFILNCGDSRKNPRYQCRVRVIILVTIVGAKKIGVDRYTLSLRLRASGLEFVGSYFEYGFDQAFSKDEERVPPLVIVVFGIQVTLEGLTSFANEKI